MTTRKPLNLEIGSRIKFARKRANFTQEQLAERIAISAKNLSFIETGRFGVGLETLIKICVELNVSSDYLLFGSASQEDSERLAKALSDLTPAQAAFVNQLLATALSYIHDPDQLTHSRTNSNGV